MVVAHHDVLTLHDLFRGPAVAMGQAHVPQDEVLVEGHALGRLLLQPAVVVP